MKMSVSSFFLLAFLILAWPSVAQQIDPEVLNKNFNDAVGLRLNNFPRPIHVKNICAVFNSGRLGFAIKFIIPDDYEKYKAVGIVTNPFVMGKTVFIVLGPDIEDKFMALLDRGHSEHERMLRVLDIFLLTLDSIFETTKQEQRNEILGRLENISKMTDNSEKEAGVWAILRQYAPPHKLVGSILAVRSRYENLYPKESLIGDLSFAVGRDLKNDLGEAILSIILGN